MHRMLKETPAQRKAHEEFRLREEAYRELIAGAIAAYQKRGKGTTIETRIETVVDYVLEQLMED